MFALILIILELAAQTFNNPVIPGDYPDPTILYHDGVYYSLGTSSEWAPHFPMFQSKDLVNWDYIGPAFTTATQPKWAASTFWAPELSYFESTGLFHLYYTGRIEGGEVQVGVAITKNLSAGFEDHGLLINLEHGAIDSFYFQDPDTKENFLLFKTSQNNAIDCYKLSADGLSLSGNYFSIFPDSKEGGVWTEGMQMIKTHGFYQLIYSLGQCCGSGCNYTVNVARSKTINGTYEKYGLNPILHGNKSSGSVLCCGHGTVAFGPNSKYYYMHHAYLNGAGYYLGRQGMITEMAFNEEDWPYFIQGTLDVLPQPVYISGTTQRAISDFADPMTGSSLAAPWGWNFAYATLNASYVKNSKSAVASGNVLSLTGTTKGSNIYGTVLGIRALKTDYTVATQVGSIADNTQAISIYGDSANLVYFGLEGPSIILKKVESGKESTLGSTALSGDVYLRMVVTGGNTATFSYRTSATGSWTTLGGGNNVNVSYLTRGDRAFRPGLIHLGQVRAPSIFYSFEITYK